MTGPLTTFLTRKKPLILDGAMGTELQRRGVDTGLPLWSANALMTAPELVRQIHQDYLSAGADILTTNTFRTTRRTFRRARLPDRSSELTATAVRLTGEARALFPEKTVLIAGSMAPLEDCYRPDLVPTEAELKTEHAELAGRLANGHVDFLLLETMNTIREAVAACEAATATGLETIVSFLCRRDGSLYGGELLSEAVRALAPLEPTAFSINCIPARFINKALSALREATPLPFAVYANVGIPEQEQGGALTQDVLPEEYASCAREWLRDGAVIIGGCCGTTPEYIASLRQAFNDTP